MLFRSRVSLKDGKEALIGRRPAYSQAAKTATIDSRRKTSGWASQRRDACQAVGAFFFVRGVGTATIGSFRNGLAETDWQKETGGGAELRRRLCAC